MVARGPEGAERGASGNGLEVDWQAPGETSAEVRRRAARTRRRRSAGGGAARREQRRRTSPMRWRRSAPRSSTSPCTGGIHPTMPGPPSGCSSAPRRARLHAVTFTCAYAVGSAFALAAGSRRLRTALDGPRGRGGGRARVRRRAPPARGARPSSNPAGPARRHGAGAGAVACPRATGCCGPTGMSSGGRATCSSGTATPRRSSPASEARLLEALVERAPAVVAKVDLVDDGSRRARRRGGRRPAPRQARPAGARHPVRPPPRLRQRPRGRPRGLNLGRELPAVGARRSGSGVAGVERRVRDGHLGALAVTSPADGGAASAIQA